MKKFYFSLLALMCTLMASATLQGGSTLYLDTGGSGLWNQASAWFAGYFWTDGGAEAWAKFEVADGQIYKATLPEGSFEKLIVLRKDPSNTNLNWDNEWNRIGDITHDGTSNMIVVTGWNADSYKWSTYSSGEEGGDDPVVSTDYYNLVGNNINGASWDPSKNEAYVDAATGLCTWTLESLQGEFKVALNGSWDVSWGAGSNSEITLGEDYQAVKGSNINIKLATAASNVTVTFNPTTEIINVTAESTGEVQLNYIVRGDYNNDWGTENAITFSDEDGDGVYTATAETFDPSGAFKIYETALGTWYGGSSAVTLGTEIALDSPGEDLVFTAFDTSTLYYNVTFTFDPTAMTLKVDGLNVTSNTRIYQNGVTEWVWYQLWVYGLNGVETTDVSATIEAKDSDGNVVETKTVALIVDGDGNKYEAISFTTLAQGTTYTFVGTVTITLADGTVVTVAVADKEFTTMAEDPDALKATLEYTVAATETEATLSYKVTVTGNTAEPTSYKVWLDAPGNVEMASGDTAEGELKVDLTGGAVTYWLKGQVVVDEQTINTDPNDLAVTFTPKTPAPEVENANIAAGEEGWSQLGTPLNEAEAWAPAAYHETTIDENGILSFSITLPSVPAVGFVANAYVSSVEGEQGSEFYDLALAATPAEVTNGIVTYTATSGEKAYTELPVYVTYRFAYAGGESKVKQIAVGESGEEEPVYEYCLAGSVNGWSLEANRVEAVDGVATWTFDEFSGEFKIVKNEVGVSEWENVPLWGAADGAKLEVGTEYTSVLGGDNIGLTNTDVKYTGVTVTFNEATGVILVTAEGEVPLATTYEFTGDVNDWAIDGTYFTEESEGVYTLTLEKLYGSFKVIKNHDWSGSLITDETFMINTDYTLANINEQGRNINLTEGNEWVNATLTLTVAEDGTVTLRGTAERVTGIEGIEADNAAGVEYYNLQGLKVENPENGLFIRKQGNKVSKVLVK